VERWIKANGGPQAVARLADRVAQGERFQAAAGQALSQWRILRASVFPVLPDLPRNIF
jgi:hypothetical protein